MGVWATETLDCGTFKGTMKRKRGGEYRLKSLLA